MSKRSEVEKIIIGLIDLRSFSKREYYRLKNMVDHSRTELFYLDLIGKTTIEIERLKYYESIISK